MLIWATKTCKLLACFAMDGQHSWWDIDRRCHVYESLWWWHHSWYRNTVTDIFTQSSTLVYDDCWSSQTKAIFTHCEWEIKCLFIISCFIYWVSNQWTIINRDNKRRGHEFLGGLVACSPRKFWKLEALKTPFSALSGQNMWQNGIENWWRFSLYFYLKKCLSGYSTYTP